MDDWNKIMTYVIGIPLSLLGFYIFMRLASYAVCKSIKQVFGSKNHNTKENCNGKEGQEI